MYSKLYVCAHITIPFYESLKSIFPFTQRYKCKRKARTIQFYSKPFILLNNTLLWIFKVVTCWPKMKKLFNIYFFWNWNCVLYSWNFFPRNKSSFFPYCILHPLHNTSFILHPSFTMSQNCRTLFPETF